MSRVLLDPTSERHPAERQRVARPASLAGMTVGLLDISKPRNLPAIGPLSLQPDKAPHPPSPVRLTALTHPTDGLIWRWEKDLETG